MLTPRASYMDLAKAGFILALGAALLVAFLVFLSGNWLFERHKSYFVKFASVRELAVGRPVRYAGLQIGRVKSLAIDESHPVDVLVELSIKRSFTIYGGTAASIAQRGLVGENYIALELQGEPGPPLPPGSWLPTKPGVGLAELSASLGSLAVDLKPRIERIADRLDKVLSGETVARIEETARNVSILTGEENRRRVGETLDRLPGLIAEARQAVSGLRAEAHGVGASSRETLRLTGETVRKTGDKVADALDVLSKTLTELNARSGQALAGINALTQTAHAGLESDQERLESIFENLHRASVDLRNLAASLRERPWLILRGQGEGGGP